MYCHSARQPTNKHNIVVSLLTDSYFCKVDMQKNSRTVLYFPDCKSTSFSPKIIANVEDGKIHETSPSCENIQTISEASKLW